MQLKKIVVKTGSILSRLFTVPDLDLDDLSHVPTKELYRIIQTNPPAGCVGTFTQELARRQRVEAELLRYRAGGS